MGLPDEDLGIGEDRIVDPGGGGPSIWSQLVPGTVVRVLQEDGLDHYAVAVIDPEGNEFDVN